MSLDYYYGIELFWVNKFETCLKLAYDTSTGLFVDM